jgi:hypothetical protein
LLLHTLQRTKRFLRQFLSPFKRNCVGFWTRKGDVPTQKPERAAIPKNFPLVPAFGFQRMGWAESSSWVQPRSSTGSSVW